MKFVIFKVKWRLPNKSANKIFLHKTPHTPPLFLKKIALPSHNLLETSTFYHSFTSFHSRWVLCCISNKYQPLNNIAKHQYFYTRDFISLFHFDKILALSIAKVFETSSIYHISLLTVSEVCNISNKHYLVNKSANETFFHKAPYTLPPFQNKCAFHCRSL